VWRGQRGDVDPDLVPQARGAVLADVMMRVPLGAKATERRAPVWRRIVALSLPSSAAHRRALPSLQAVSQGAGRRSRRRRR
jgi:hypothetical protein